MLPAAPRWRRRKKRLRDGDRDTDRAGPAELCGRLLLLLLPFASSFLLVPVGCEAPVAFYLPSSSCVFSGLTEEDVGLVSLTHDSSDAGIAHMNNDWGEVTGM